MGSCLEEWQPLGQRAQASAGSTCQWGVGVERSRTGLQGRLDWRGPARLWWSSSQTSEACPPKGGDGKEEAAGAKTEPLAEMQEDEAGRRQIDLAELTGLSGSTGARWTERRRRGWWEVSAAGYSSSHMQCTS